MTLDPPVTYHKNPFGLDLVGVLKTYENLMKEVEWVKRTEAREECFQSNGGGHSYTYGGGIGARTYISVHMTQTVLDIMDILNDEYGGAVRSNVREWPPVDLCFLNRYHTEKNQLGWHADDSPEVDQDAPIHVVSFGAVRELWVRPRGHKGGATHKFKLASGSLLVMKPGMQATWDHRIPKHDRPCGERISLTYRRMKV